MITTINNIFAYANNCEKMFDNMASQIGYSRQTTFYSDLSIAECYGEKAIRKTFNAVMKNWRNDVKYFTEFVLALNWKIWQHHDKMIVFNNEAIHEQYENVYNELWQQAYEYGFKHFKDDDLTYYYTTLD